MDNDELLVVIKGMFEQSMDKVYQKIDELKVHNGVLFEKMGIDIKAVAEGHDILNTKMDNLENRFDILENKFDKLENKVDKLEGKVDELKVEMKVVQDYVIGVDQKLNEHEVILKRVK